MTSILLTEARKPDEGYSRRALMETFQTPEGRIRIPAALQPYMGGLEKIG